MCWIWRAAISSDSSTTAFPFYLHADDLQGICQRRQRVAQLVGQHGQELVLSLTRLLQFLGLPEELHLHSLPVGDVRDQAQSPFDRILAVAKRIHASTWSQRSPTERSRASRAPETSILREERPLGLETASPRAPRALSRRSRSTVVRGCARSFDWPARLDPMRREA